MCACRGEVLAAPAADATGIPLTLSTASVYRFEEVAPKLARPVWFELYMLKVPSL